MYVLYVYTCKSSLEASLSHSWGRPSTVTWSQSCWTQKGVGYLTNNCVCVISMTICVPTPYTYISCTYDITALFKLLYIVCGDSNSCEVLDSLLLSRGAFNAPDLFDQNISFFAMMSLACQSLLDAVKSTRNVGSFGLKMLCGRFL